MEIIKQNKFIKCCRLITTDKVYQNYKSKKFFDETSQLGGDDIYSDSKACCELLVHSYRKSFIEKQNAMLLLLELKLFCGGD